MRMAGRASLAVAVVLGVSTAGVVRATAAGPPYPPTVAYVTGLELTPVDTATNTAGPAIDIGGRGIAITSDGKTAYELTDGSMRSIDLATGTVGAFVNVGKNPARIAISPDGSTAYVAHSDDSICAVDLATGVAGTEVGIYDKSGDIAITPDGQTIYAADYRIGSVIALTSDLAHRTLIPVGIRTAAVAISPDGATAYFSARNGTIVPVDTATQTAETPIVVSADGLGAIAITPDGTTAYVADSAHFKVIPVDLGSGTAGTPISTIGEPNAIAISPDGATVYVANSNQTLVPIDVATNVAGAPISIALGPDDIAITPDQAPIARFRAVPAAAGNATRFDAAKSAGVSGPITRYHWRFGDGTAATTSSAVTQHVYAAPGSYRVTLVVTDAAGTSTTQVFTGRMMSRNGGPSARKTHRVTIG